MKLYKFFTAVLLCIGFSSHAQSADITPYVNWILKNTRFSAAADAPARMYPEIEILPAKEYKELLGDESVGMYRFSINKIFVNRDYYAKDDSVLLHELVHFFQFVQGPLWLCHEQYEMEAYEIQIEYLNSLKKVKDKKTHEQMKASAATMIKAYWDGFRCSPYPYSPVIDISGKDGQPAVGYN